MIPILPVLKSSMKETAEHVQDAQATGSPALLRYRGLQPAGGWDRPAIANLPRTPGLAWDEYPFASTMEYVALSGWNLVSVREVPAWQQSLQGAELRWFY